MFIIFHLCLHTTISPPLYAQEIDTTEVRESKIKAAFIYYATIYSVPLVTTDNSQRELTICVLGDPITGKGLASLLQGKKARGMSIVTQQIDSADLQSSNRILSNCDVVYLPLSTPANIKLEDLELKSHALTVGDSPTFLEAGGMVQISKYENKITFMINIDAVEKASLKMSSEFLALARRVVKRQD